MGLMHMPFDTDRRSPYEVNHRYHYDTSDDRVIIESEQDVEPILKGNREMRNANDGYTKDRSMKRVARIPLVVVEKIIREQGWDPLHQDNRDRLLQLLDDPDYSHFKTSEGRHARKARRQYTRASISTKLVHYGDE